MKCDYEKLCESDNRYFCKSQPCSVKKKHADEWLQEYRRKAKERHEKGLRDMQAMRDGTYDYGLNKVVVS